MSSTQPTEEESGPRKAPARFLRTYEECFVLDGSKLSRVMTILEAAAKGVQLNVSVEIVQKNHKRIALTTIDEVLRLDNPVHNPVRKLTLEASAEDVFTSEVEYIASGDLFQGPRAALDVYSADSKVGSELFAEIEEQLERTFVRGPMYSIKKLPGLFLVGLFGVLTAVLATVALSTTVARNPRMTLVEAEGLRSLAKDATTLNEQVRFLFEAEKRRIEDTVRTQSKSLEVLVRSIFTIRAAFVAVPVLVVIGCFVYLWRTCYPLAVFAWGDVGEHYGVIVGRRKFIWSAIVTAFAVGVFTSFFVIGLTGYVKP